MSADSSRPTTLHLLSLAGLSAAMLAFEVLLLRLFEFSHWHHFAGFALSLALLGLGSAGTVLALAGRRAQAMGDGWFLGGLALMAAGLLSVIWLQSHVALRPLFAFTDFGEFARMLAVDLAAFVPFFGAGLAIGQAFMRWPDWPGRLYSANLLGSAAGSIAASVMLVWMQVETALSAVVFALVLLGLCLAAARRLAMPALTCLVLLAPAGLFLWQPPQAAVSDFKALARVGELPDARVLAVEPGLPGRLTVMRSDSLRFAPGLSLQWPRAVPAMDAAVIGSDRLVPLAREYGDSMAHVEGSLAGLAFRLRPDGAVLALGASAWSTPAQLSGRRLTWVEKDARLLRRAAERGTGAHLELVADDPLRYLANEESARAVISLDGAHAGGDAASEDYLLTTGGLALALSRLAPDGLLALPLPVEYPPRQGPRALATVRGALQRHGAAAPGAHVAALRSMQEQLILVSPAPLPDKDLQAIRAFADEWRFDLVWLPGMESAQANRFHRLDEPAFHQAAFAVFEGGRMPAAATWFETAPAGMWRPYFWRAMRWSRVPDLLDRMGPRALSHLDWTLILSAAAALLVAVLGFLLMLAPLGRLPAIRAPLDRLSVAGYFTALGLGYMLLELAVFQRVILFLGEPVLAASVVFALFMAGSGVGSAMAPGEGRGGAVLRIYAPIAFGLLLAAGGLWLSGYRLAGPGLATRIAAIVALVLPLAWALGRPFPWGLRRISEQRRWIPWAWGINGFASVVGASLAPLLSVHLGQVTSLAAGAGCYAVAAGIGVLWTRRS